MTHSDKINELAGSVLEAQSTIRLTVTVLLDEDSDAAQQSVGALSLAADKLQTVLEDLEKFQRDLSEKQVTTG